MNIIALGTISLIEDRKRIYYPASRSYEGLRMYTILLWGTLQPEKNNVMSGDLKGKYSIDA